MRSVVPASWSSLCLLAASCRDRSGSHPSIDAAAASPSLPDVAPPLTGDAGAALRKGVVDLQGDLLLTLGDRPLGELVEDTFYVFSTDPATPFDAAVAQTRAMVAALWHGHHFTHRLQSVVPIWVFATTREMDQAIMHYGALPGVATNVSGLYDPTLNEIFFATQPAGLTTLDPQMCRPMLAGDFVRSDLHAWLGEGFCALFEDADVSASGETRFHSNARTKVLVDALKDPAKASDVQIQSLFAMSNEEFARDEPLHTALAREMMRLLASRGQLWDWYHGWRDQALSDPTGEKALLAVTGKTPQQLNGEVVAWVQGAGALTDQPALSSSRRDTMFLGCADACGVCGESEVELFRRALLSGQPAYVTLRRSRAASCNGAQRSRIMALSVSTRCSGNRHRGGDDEPELRPGSVHGEKAARHPVRTYGYRRLRRDHPGRSAGRTHHRRSRRSRRWQDHLRRPDARCRRP